MNLPAALRLVSALLSLAAVARLAVPRPGFFFGVSALEISADRMALERRYTTPHSLGDNYVFDPRDGWQTVNTTNLLYKYQRRTITKHASYEPDPDDHSDDSGDTLLRSEAGKQPRGYTHGTGGTDLAASENRDHAHTNGTGRMKLVRRARKSQSGSKAPKSTSKSKSKPKSKSKDLKPVSTNNAKKDILDGASTQNGLLNSFKKVFQSIRPLGKPEPVTITWYTGHDLDNPSCWSNPTWAPTDKSFAAALTLVGWESKPECFKFLELCNTPQKCVFARVVDSCEGCAQGSKHVDLTKAAFQNLADLDEGLLTVQMRQATDPLDGWFEELWGPRMSENH
ncbi:hypothetical protein LXA43DRAFT_1178275 [Ganoderma leucocontextum]|nr:hypothetical protein LXA43DRAFT_1178275 [Ganoderma leucocontextum]